MEPISLILGIGFTLYSLVTKADQNRAEAGAYQADLAQKQAQSELSQLETDAQFSRSLRESRLATAQAQKATFEQLAADKASLNSVLILGSLFFGLLFLYTLITRTLRIT